MDLLYCHVCCCVMLQNFLICIVSQGALLYCVTGCTVVLSQGMLLYRDRKLRMAEKALRMGVHVEPTSAELWATLGNVLQELNDTETAANCHMTAMDLEATSSLIPLSAISKIMVA